MGVALASSLCSTSLNWDEPCTRNIPFPWFIPLGLQIHRSPSASPSGEAELGQLTPLLTPSHASPAHPTLAREGTATHQAASPPLYLLKNSAFSLRTSKR